MDTITTIPITSRLIAQVILEAEGKFPKLYDVTEGALKLSNADIPSCRSTAFWRAYYLGISKAKLACQRNICLPGGGLRALTNIGLVQFKAAVKQTQGTGKARWIDQDLGLAFASAELSPERGSASWELAVIFWEMGRHLMQSYIFARLLAKLPHE